MSGVKFPWDNSSYTWVWREKCVIDDDIAVKWIDEHRDLHVDATCVMEHFATETVSGKFKFCHN